MPNIENSRIPRGPCLPAKIDSPLSRGHFRLAVTVTRLSQCLPNCLSPTREVSLSSFQNCPRRDCAATNRQRLSCGNFCLAASRCLSRPSVQQPKRCRVGPGQSARKTAKKTAGRQPRQSKQLFFQVFRLFFRLFSADLPGPTRHLFRLFSGCRAFGTSVGGRRACKSKESTSEASAPFCDYPRHQNDYMQLSVLGNLFSQARKKSTKIKFLGPETARWGGGLPRKGVVDENFVPALETLSSLGFEERNPGCPGNFAGMSQTPGGVQKVCAKKLRAHFSFPIF